MENLPYKLYNAISLSRGNSIDPVSIDYAPGSEHISIKHDVWTVSGWKENDVQFKGNKIIDQVEKLQLELANDIINNKNTNTPGDGETSSLVKEYAMLLQKMEKGLLQTEGRERLNILKSRLGLAQGGITNVNMNRGKPGEVLSKLGELLYG